MSGAQNSEYLFRWPEYVFDRPPVKYMWVERDYEEEKEVQQTDSNEPIPDSTLEPEVQVRWQQARKTLSLNQLQALCNMIFSTKCVTTCIIVSSY